METAIIKRVLNIEEAAATLGLCPNKIRQMLRSGELKSVRAGDRWLIPTWAIDDFLNKAKCGA